MAVKGAGGPGRAAKGGKAAKPRPEPVGGLVEAVLDRLGIAEKVDRAVAAAEWERLVGPHIARVTGHARVRGRTLFVEVESASWLAELNMVRHDLLRRLNEGRTRGRIEKIVFVQAGGRGSDRAGRRGGRANERGRYGGGRYGEG